MANDRVRRETGRESTSPGSSPGEPAGEGPGRTDASQLGHPSANPPEATGRNGKLAEDHGPAGASTPPDPLEAVYQQLKRFPDEYGRSDDPAKSRWPEAHALMSRVHFANGKSREPGRLTIQLGPTGVEWQLVDVTMGYKLVGACNHLHELWESVQHEATNPSAKWMPLRYGEGYQLRKQMERKAIDDAANRR